MNRFRAFFLPAAGGAMMLVLFVTAVFSFSFPPSAAVAHGVYKPPPPPVPSPPRSHPIQPGIHGNGLGPATPGGPTIPGPAVPGGPTTLGPAGRGGITGGPGRPGGGRGAFTKRNRAVTAPTNTWEEWWARNRYRFLNFSGKNSGARYVYTPSGERGPEHSASAPSGLRLKCARAISPFLKSPSAQVRRTAALALGRLDDETSLPTVIAFLEDRNETVRTAAVLALGFFHSSRARYILLNIAGGTRAGRRFVNVSTLPPAFRGYAGIALALARDRDAARVLTAAAEDEDNDPGARALALEGLGLLGGPKALRFLSSFTERKKTDTRLLSAAVTALSKTGDSSVLPVLTRCLGAKETILRQSAALALGSLASPRDPDAMKALFCAFAGTCNPCLKGFALTAMGEIGGLDAVKKLELVLKRGTSVDLAWAGLGLGIALSSMPGEKVPDVLLSKLKKKGSVSTRGAMAIALGLARCKEAAPDLIRLVEKGGDPYFRGYCAMALGMIGDPAAIPALRDALLEKNLYPLCTQAALALSLMHDRGSVPVLTDLLLTTKSLGVMVVASRGLLWLGADEEIDRLLDFLATTRSKEGTYMAVITLLSKLAVGQKIPFLGRVAARSNYSCEYPVVASLLENGI